MKEEAFTIEQNAGVMVKARAQKVSDSLIRDAIALQGKEETRHARLIQFMLDHYGIEIPKKPAAKLPEKLNQAFLDFGYGECLDSFLAFGLFKIARLSGIFPEPLFDDLTPHLFLSACLKENSRRMSRFDNRLLQPLKTIVLKTHKISGDYSMLARYAMLGTFSLLLAASLPVHARQTCTPLKVVDGEGTEVTKQVSIPALIGPFGIRTGNNWNTDFAVPSNVNFKVYIATIQSNSTAEGTFNIKMYLKYSDNTADNTFDGSETLQPGKSVEVTGAPRSGKQPFQVNLNVGGTNAVGFTYTLSVRGCR